MNHTCEFECVVKLSKVQGNNALIDQLNIDHKIRITDLVLVSNDSSIVFSRNRFH